MKKHIAKEQYEQLTPDEKAKIDIYYYQHRLPKEENELEFWNVGNMIEYLETQAFLNANRIPSNKSRWIDQYGFDLNNTALEQRCDKLWEKVKIA